MRQSRFTEAQIIGMIKEQEAGMPTVNVCRRHGLSPATFYKFKAKFGGMNVSDPARLKALLKHARLRLAFLTDTFLSLILPTDPLSVQYASRKNLFHCVK